MKASTFLLVTMLFMSGLLTDIPETAASGAPQQFESAAQRAEAPEIQRGPSPWLTGKSSAVFFAGDSLTYDTWHWAELERKATKAGWRVSGVWARGGLRASQLAAGWPRLAEDLPGTVLVAIGANDVMHDTHVGDFRRAISRIIRLSPARRVILVSIYARSDPLLAAREARLNAVLRSVARSNARVSLVDWGVRVDRNPSWPVPDEVFRIHLTPEGLRARALFYVSSLGPAPRP